MACEGSLRRLGEVRVIPVEILHVHSRHIRYLILRSTLPEGTIQSTLLRQVYLAKEAINANTDLLLSNPLVPDLRLEFDEDSDITAIQPALKSLTKLRTQTMNCVHITSQDQLSGVRNNNATALRKLSYDMDVSQAYQNLKDAGF